MKVGLLQFFSWPDRRVPLPSVYERALRRIDVMEQTGYDAVWLAEHHFTGYSVCPSVHIMATHVAARTQRLRIGTAVTLAAFQHPLRIAEDIALLDVLSGGRVNWGAGRGFDPTEFASFGVPPAESSERFREAVEIVLAAWQSERLHFEGKFHRFDGVEVLPKPLQQPHPPIWGATTSLEGHTEMGRLGIGLCSFAVGLPPESFKEKVDAYRAGIAQCKQPVGKFMNDQAATFTMVHCADTNERAFSEAAESMVWYPVFGAKQIAAVADWQAGKDLGNYAYAGDMKTARDSGGLDQMNFDYIRDSGAAMVGDPARCIEIGERYAASGCDMLFCLVNPYKIPHKAVMRSIELLGEKVIPALS